MYDPPKKMDKNKKIEVAILVGIIIWGIIFAINYSRYSSGKSLILATKHTINYEDGTVIEYRSIGYTYRIYSRKSITTDELVPFWQGRKGIKTESDLPQTYNDYTVPKNKEKLTKYKGLIYMYNKKSRLIGTYKCINSSTKCELAQSGKDKFNIYQADKLTAIKEYPTMQLVYDKYAFIEDSKEQKIDKEDARYTKIIYLLDIKENKIIAKYADVKFSYLYYANSEYGEISDTGDFIVKDDKTKKWGVMNINEDGQIKEKLSFEYDSINYDDDTSYYIVCKDGKWNAITIKNKKEQIKNSIETPIYDVWINNNDTLYYKTSKETTDNEGNTKNNFQIYNKYGMPLIDKLGVINTYEKDKFVYYLDENDKSLHFIDYSGEEKQIIPLQFINLDHEYNTKPSFTVTYKGKYMEFRVYESDDYNSDYSYYSIEYKTLS